ncbi:cilia- and flagella- associated protein 210 [Spea bombifrons]|uniref:cilia- and flagella- associated protein 210 n=1 Tax=Spea bombifrons TaxID=233779 RepID=UPI0023490939|nr:cilia- and flagella- associated protein 210 [Spea bombifrons]
MASAFAPVVQHGRRRGQNSRVQSAESNSENDRGFVVSKPVDLRQVTVLPKAEWERILTYTNTIEQDMMEFYEEKREREALHLRSKEMVKNWKNTLAGMRQQKLEAKQLREEEEEERKKMIDIEEAKYQAERRKEAIENAKLKQYYQTDKVKKFHSALLLTEVLKEREAQIALKKQMDKAKHSSNVNQDLEGCILDTKTKTTHQTTDKRETAKELLKQIEEQNHKAELERLANKREGGEIQRQTRIYEWEMQKLAKMKQDEKKEIMKAHLATVADRDFIRAREQQKEMENEELIQRYALAKKKMGQLRKEREQEIYRQILERRDDIGNRLAAQIKQQVDDEDERVAKAIAELDAKNTKESQQKVQKIKEDIKAIAEHRQAMRRKKEMEEKQEKLNAIKALHAIKEADNVFIAQQMEKQRKTDEEHKRMQAIQLQQMAEKKTMALLEKDAELNYTKQNETLLAKEEEQFQEYAKQVIDSAIKAKRNPFPLKKAAEVGTGGGHGPLYSRRGGIRPSYQVQDTSGVQLPSFKSDNAQQIKDIYDTGDIQQGKRKLGFTW